MTLDFNDEGPDWLPLLEQAEDNAETDFEIEFCESLRERAEKYGDTAQLTDAQQYKLSCIARAGGFWERDQ